MTVYETNYKARLDFMLNSLIKSLGLEDSRVIFFATLKARLYNQPHYKNREKMEKYYKKYMAEG
jgi:hypothetical protein